MTMRNFPHHFWQRFQELREEPALSIVGEEGDIAELTYWEWTRRVQRIAVAFMESGLEVGERVAVVARNRRDWIDVAVGAWLAGGVLVPVPPGLDRGTTLECLGRTGASWIVVEDGDAYRRIRGQGASLPDHLEWMMLQWDGESEPGDATTLLQFEEEGRSLVARGRVDDLAERIYGLDLDRPSLVLFEHPPGEDPHGAFFTDESVAKMLDRLGSDLPFEQAGRPAVLSSYASPLAFLIAAAALLEGAGLAVGERPGHLRDHLDTVQPTHLVCGADYLLDKTARWRKRLEEAPEFMRSDTDDGDESESTSPGGFSFDRLLNAAGDQAAERLFYRPLRQSFGGELDAILLLGQILPDDVEHVLESADVEILDVFGYPECGVSHLERSGERRPDAVGRTVQGYECRIHSPDDSDDETGEILIASDTLFEDYWDGEGPRAVEKGWLRTGDVGRVVDGFLIPVSEP